MDRIGVFIADDHFVVLEGLQRIIEREMGMYVAGTARDGFEAVKKAKNCQPDVVLLDILMPRLNGLEAIPLIKETLPETQVIILSMYEKEPYIRQALSAGARGFILKTTPGHDVLKAIRTVHMGHYYLSPKISGEVIRRFLGGGGPEIQVSPDTSLTDRELQIMRLIVAGNSTRMIADMLCLSPKTVEKHRVNIMRKVGVNDPVSLA
ncbi:MAG: response regulator transcription factor, partial [Deltaproteobacteria bacterium]|nr:response regulator transcription factor [Deltaproteobacteria bacterium]